jgi:hypothetical protein
MTEAPTLDDILLRMLADSGVLAWNADPTATAQRFAMLAGEVPLRMRDQMMHLGCDRRRSRRVAQARYRRAARASAGRRLGKPGLQAHDR